MKQTFLIFSILVSTSLSIANTQSVQVGDYAMELFGRNSGPHKVIEISPAERIKLSDGQWYRKANVSVLKEVNSINGIEPGDYIHERGTNSFGRGYQIITVTDNGYALDKYNKWYKVEDIQPEEWFATIKATLRRTDCNDIGKLRVNIDKQVEIAKIKYFNIMQEADITQEPSPHELKARKMISNLTFQNEYLRHNLDNPYCIKTIDSFGETQAFDSSY